jgi:hypothetical protein
MAEIVNLNRARKAANKAAQTAQASANALRFGLTKAEKSAQKARDDKAARDLDGHALNIRAPE